MPGVQKQQDSQRKSERLKNKPRIDMIMEE
jgi:hypothetical protein